VKAVILAGGLGTRLREETEFRPKPMVEIGGRPIIWHIMKFLSSYGINDFIICTGYKGEFIKDYFTGYHARNHDVTVTLGRNSNVVHYENVSTENWKVTISDTGLSTQTGGRIKRISKYIDSEPFLCTYGDGLADIDIKSLINFHNQHGKIATVTGVKPVTRFGAMDIDQASAVRNFSEKPLSEAWVNGGYFIFNPEIFDYLSDDCILEKAPLEMLSNQGELMSYKHDGFWQPMDTYRETLELNELWESKKAPWFNWGDS
jgi:glucose-1-phosphate cytidylyltransferase